MKTHTPEELKSVLEQHAKWLRCEEGGSRANLRGANLRGADLRGVDLRGVDLRGVDLRGVDLRGVDLRGADLRGVDLRGADLRGANLRGADLTGADLTGADLRGVDQTGAEGNDAMTLFAVPSLHRKMLAAIEHEGCKLDMATWHQCETTHCRAGWAVQLAGPAGKALEWAIGSAAAGALISIASCPALEGKVPNFYAGNEEALADIRRLAALEEELEATV